MNRAIVVAAAIVLVPIPVSAEPGGRCSGGICDVDQGPRPWVLTDDCKDTSDVVGYRHCAKFGQWSASARDPELVLGVGIGLRHIVAPRPVVTDATPMAVARTVAGPTPMADIATSELRFTRAVRSLYAGAELSLGDLTGRTYPYGAFIQGGGLLGIQAPLGPLDFAAEALVAGRSIRLTTNINRLAPADTEAVIEVRARVAWWLTPWITLECEGGAGVLDRSEWVTAVGVGFHTRAFGGRR